MHTVLLCFVLFIAQLLFLPLTAKVHYNDVIMSAMASQITSVSIVCSTVCPSADQRKHQSSASLAFLWGIHQWPANSPHKPVTWKMFPFDDVIMLCGHHPCFGCLSGNNIAVEHREWYKEHMFKDDGVLDRSVNTDFVFNFVVCVSLITGADIFTDMLLWIKGIKFLSSDLQLTNRSSSRLAVKYVLVRNPLMIKSMLQNFVCWTVNIDTF